MIYPTSKGPHDVKLTKSAPRDVVDLGPLLVGGDVGKVSDHDDGLLLAVHGRLQVVGGLAVLSV